MSFSTFLSKKAELLDDDLDAVFKTSAGTSTSLNTLATEPQSKKKSTEKRNSKKRQADDEQQQQSKKSRVDGKVKGLEAVVATAAEDGKVKGKKGKGKEKASADTKETASGPVESGIAIAEARLPLQADQDEVEIEGDAESDNSDSSQVPVHETLAKRKKKTAKKVKYVPEGETKEQRDARTLFLGNLPAQVVKARPMVKKLKRHITSLVPGASIESIRFRSVPFQNPTSKLDGDEDETSKKEDTSTKEQRQQKRASEWRETKKATAEKEDDELRRDEKSYMTPAQKRRLASIKGDLHDSASRVNAYIVFAHPIPPHMRTSKAPEKDVMDPYDAVIAAVSACDGTTFEEHTLRADFVGKTASAGAGVLETLQADPKLSIFVGNLDFAATEEDLRAFFEALMCSERGTAPVLDDEGNSRSAKGSTWVTSVRIVRDRETQLGKGFAYVQLADRECVDEILALEAAKLKFAKRALRVQRCKTLPGTRIKIAPTTKATTTKASTDRPRGKSDTGRRASVPVPVQVPKGNPLLGEQLAGLSKEERKVAKAKDNGRVARRLAKKKAKGVMEKEGVKPMDNLKLRMRARNKSGAKVNTGRKSGKPRVRSERASGLKNTKKQ